VDDHKVAPSITPIERKKAQPGVIDIFLCFLVRKDIFMYPIRNYFDILL